MEPAELLLRREFDNGYASIGVLYLDGVLQCYTLEDTSRHGYGVGGCIPPGRYKVTYEPSPKLKRDTLRLHGVPKRSGILIHAGNTADDVAGCIAVGRQRISKDRVNVSQTALLSLERKVIGEIRLGKEVYITVESPMLMIW